MDHRHELGEFLRAKRAATPPTGAPFVTEGRRVPGLRREEVAELARISETYYTKLERGKVPGISAAVLNGLADALAITAQEQTYVRSLIPVGGDPVTSDSGTARTIEAPLRRMLDALGATPVHVQNVCSDIIATNLVGRAFYPFHFEHGDQPNSVSFLFLDPRARDFYVDWDVWARQSVHYLRASAAREPRNRELASLVVRLRERSPEFDAAWSTHDVRSVEVGTRVIHHPVVGELALDFQALQPVRGATMRVFVYTAEPGSASAARLGRLAQLAEASTARSDL